MSLFNRKKQKESAPPPKTNPALSETEKQSLADTIRHADTRIAEIDALLESWGLREQDLAAAELSYHRTIFRNGKPSHPRERDTVRAQILRQERRELVIQRQRAAEGLRMPTAEVLGAAAAKAEREQRILDMHVRERTEGINRNVAMYEKAGDYGQAAIWRNELNGLRARIASELGIRR